MKLSRKGRVAVASAVLVLALFVVRPGATRLRTRIANSIGMALQRQVDISRVHLRLLPQPGFDLDGFVVHDDPAFGAEPVLRAPEVSAFLRLSSLLRGRMEVSRLSLSEPSLNLVRREDGHWNIETFLARTASIAVAPTSNGRSQSRPAFPYIEADRGRINFKVGPEKKPFALTDATYSLWQDSENTWGVRFKGQPVRTDFNLSDTGQLSIDGTWQRAANLHETPVQFKLTWDGAQLGQLTKFVSGEDRGWRGTVRVGVMLEGSPVDLLVRADTSLLDFHRYDITETKTVDLRSLCVAHYDSTNHSLHQILCQTPVGDGSVMLTSKAADLSGTRDFELHFTAEKVPSDAVLAVIRRAKKNLPSDLRATGTLDAKLEVRASGSTPVIFEGDGETSNLHLISSSSKTDLGVDVLPFSVTSGSAADAVKKVHGRRDATVTAVTDGPQLSVGPVAVKLGRSTPLVVQGSFARTGYSVSIKGEAELQRLLAFARVAGIPSAHPTASGTARVDLQMAGAWQGFASPLPTGTAELHGVRAQVRGFNGPLEISLARVTLAETATKVEGLSAAIAGTQWNGALSLPRPCAPGPVCSVSFDLHADEISTDRLNGWLNPNVGRPWYRFGLSESSGGHSFLTAIRATGMLSANRLLVRNLTATHVSTKVVLEQGTLRLTDLTADVLGGKQQGEWRADFTAKPPSYAGSGTLDGVSLAQLSESMHDKWIVGAASAKYQVELSGLSAAELADSAKGTLQFEMRDGALPHILLNTTPLRVRRFSGILSAKDGAVELQESTLDSPTTSYTVTGKASLTRKLNFKLVAEGAPGLNVTGTIAEPRVAPAQRPETQAALKP